MKTDDLIRALATDLTPESPVSDGLWLRLGLALAVCVALIGATLGFREELGTVLLNPVSALRPVLALALFGTALRMMFHLARPDGEPLVRYDGVFWVAGLAAVAVVWALATTPPGDWGSAVIGSTLVWCLTSIPVLSILPVTVLLLALRRGATSRPGPLGAITGLAGGSAATATYALHCTEDSPLFYVPWYGLAIAIVTVISSRIGARLLRW